MELDVRPQLARGEEPFDLIMKTVKSLAKEDTLILHAPFKPTPLIGVMKWKGFTHRAEQVGPKHWVVTFVHKSRAHELAQQEKGERTQQEESVKEKTAAATEREPKVHILDNRGLQPPEPMVRTLNLLNRVPHGDTVIIHNDRVPVFLLQELDELGFPYTVEELEDGSARVTIRKTAPKG
ncbi:MAG TPA: DUF2249 domain-containing protein [Calditerricola sp.]